MIDSASEQEIKRILALGLGSATPEDIAFLKARRSYLTVDQQLAFGLEDESASTDEAPAPRRGRKSASTDED